MSGKFRTMDWAMALLGVMALSLSLLLTFHSVSGAGLIGCSGGSPCDTVLGSGWSMVLGWIPVAALGAGVYLAILVSLGFMAFCDDSELEDTIVKVLFALAVAVIGSMLWFSCLQFFKTKAICPYCMATHVTGIILAVLIIIRYKDRLSFKNKGIWAALGIASVAVLAVVQIVTMPEYRVQEGSAPGELPVARAGAFPTIGNPDAEHRIEVLYDYQCPHCRRIHSWLEEIAGRFGGSLSFVLCPTPLSQACNLYIPAGEDRYKGSCDLAKMALALWNTDPASFRIFDEWLFHKDDDASKWIPKSVEAARSKAEALIGEDRLDKALADEKIGRQLDITLEIFGRTTLKGRSGIPRLVYGQDWIIPDANTSQALEEAMRESFFK